MWNTVDTCFEAYIYLVKDSQGAALILHTPPSIHPNCNDKIIYVLLREVVTNIDIFATCSSLSFLSLSFYLQVFFFQFEGMNKCTASHFSNYTCQKIDFW